jgi:hypothetical protein
VYNKVTLSPIQLDHVIAEWQEHEMSTTLPFADDQMIVTVSDDSLQESLHLISDVSSKCNLTISISPIVEMKENNL